MHKVYLVPICVRYYKCLFESIIHLFLTKGIHRFHYDLHCTDEKMEA